MRVGLTWIPEAEYAAALELWPQLYADGGPAAGPDGPRSHRDYCRAAEGHFAPYVDPSGRSELVIVPLRVEPYLTWCTEQGLDPGESGTRAHYAAERARLDGDLIPWPPSRNQECWCGSGRRYKHCCRSDR